MHKPISKGLFHNIIFKCISLHLKFTVQPISLHTTELFINRENFAIWFDPKIQWYALTNSKQGRNQTYSDAAYPVCLMVKSLFRLVLLTYGHWLY